MKKKSSTSDFQQIERYIALTQSDVDSMRHVYNADGSINSIYQSKLGNNEFKNIVANMISEKIDSNDLKQSYKINVV